VKPLQLGDEIRCNCEYNCEVMGPITNICTDTLIYRVSCNEYEHNVRFENARRLTKLEKALK